MFIFLQEEIKEDGTTSIPLEVNIVYVIVDNDEDKTTLTQTIQIIFGKVQSEEIRIQAVIVDAYVFYWYKLNLYLFGLLIPDVIVIYSTLYSEGHKK